jgi:GNAT superfamily N-acetyltransferase
MSEIIIRPGRAADADEARRIVEAAYQEYVPLIGRRPGPMDDDYAERIAAGALWVLMHADTMAGVLVLIETPDCFLLDNVAVDPAWHGKGFGRALMAFAEQEAIRRGRDAIVLYTNVVMTRNIALYARIGYQETARVHEHGFERVYMKKPLTAIS